MPIVAGEANRSPHGAGEEIAQATRGSQSLEKRNEVYYLRLTSEHRSERLVGSLLQQIQLKLGQNSSHGVHFSTIEKSVTFLCVQRQVPRMHISVVPFREARSSVRAVLQK